MHWDTYAQCLLRPAAAGTDPLKQLSQSACPHLIESQHMSPSWIHGDNDDLHAGRATVQFGVHATTVKTYAQLVILYHRSMEQIHYKKKELFRTSVRFSNGSVLLVDSVSSTCAHLRLIESVAGNKELIQ